MTLITVPTTKKFALGQIVMTPGAQEAFSGEFLSRCLARHAAGDWGTLDAEDKAANDEGLKTGDRLMSAYKQGKDELWVITEADRSVSTFLLPSEY